MRKISAQSLLSLLPFPQWIPEVQESLKKLCTEKLKQNEAHGLMVRVNIFLEAYFQYRSIAAKDQNFAPDEKIVFEELRYF